MCEVCREGVAPQALSEPVVMTGSTGWGDPIFTDGDGQEWTVARDPLYENIVFMRFHR